MTFRLFRARQHRRGITAAAAALLLYGVAAAAAPATGTLGPEVLGPDVLRWLDYPSAALARDETHRLSPEATVFRAPIRAMDATFLTADFEFGPEGAGHRIPAGTRFYDTDDGRDGSPRRAHCTFPTGRVPDAELSGILSALAPVDPGERAEWRAICFYGSGRLGPLDRVEAISVSRRGRRRIVLPGLSFAIQAPASLLRHEPDRSQQTGTLEISYRVKRRGRPMLRVALTDLGAELYRERLSMYWPGDLWHEMPIDPGRLPLSIPIGFGQLTFSDFDPATGTISATVDREIVFTIDRRHPRVMVFRDLY
jgi:hypothetical protein